MSETRTKHEREAERGFKLAASPINGATITVNSDESDVMDAIVDATTALLHSAKNQCEDGAVELVLSRARMHFDREMELHHEGVTEDRA